MRKSALLLFIMLLAFTIIPTTAQDACGDLAARLQMGEGGRVLFTNGDPLNMRSAAGRDADIVARLPEGFTVDEGPSCADDLRWWRVTAGEDSGWIAEGAERVYFVEPVMREQLAAEDALAERLASLDATFVLVANGENLVLADGQFQPIETFSETYNPFVFDEYVKFIRGEMWHLTDGAGDAHEVALPTPEREERLVGFAIAEQIAWLFEGECGSTKAETFARMGASSQICTRAYTLIVTDVDGANPREVWHGLPLTDATNLQLEGWRDDGGAVFLRHMSSFAFPEPGSDPAAQQGYVPMGGLFIEIALDGTARERTPNNLEGAISGDGRWVAYDDGARYRLADADNTLIIGAEDGTIYPIPFDGSLSQLDFSPDNAHFVWADVSYNDENILTDVVFKALDLTTGAVMPLRAFSGLADDIVPEDFPQARLWLADDVLLVQHHGRLFALDVATGGSAVWTPDLPESHILIGVLRG